MSVVGEARTKFSNSCYFGTTLLISLNRAVLTKEDHPKVMEHRHRWKNFIANMVLSACELSILFTALSCSPVCFLCR